MPTHHANQCKLASLIKPSWYKHMILANVNYFSIAQLIPILKCPPVLTVWLNIPNACFLTQSNIG